MKTNKKGISIIALIASITVILILLTTVVISGFTTVNNSKKISFGTEVYMIQTAVDAYYTKNGNMYPTKDAITVTFSGMTNQVLRQFANNSDEIVDNKITLYTIDYDKIDIKDLKYGTGKDGANDVYVLSQKSGKVYYAKGVKIGNEMYYTLTDDIEFLLNYNNDKNESSTPIVTFESSSTAKWAQSVSVKVKVPSTFEGVSVSAGNDVITSSQTDSNGNDIYEVSKPGNYTITVNYTESGNNKVSKYEVDNVDNTAPIITVSKEKVNMQTGDSIGYMEIESRSDDLSGVKTVKYDYGDFSDKSTAKAHFEIHGVQANNDMILIKEGYNNITVYIEDNAGNFDVLLLDCKM